MADTDFPEDRTKETAEAIRKRDADAVAAKAKANVSTTRPVSDENWADAKAAGPFAATSPPLQWPGEDDASYRERTEGWWKTHNQRQRDGVSMRPITSYEAGKGDVIQPSDIARPKRPVHLVDIKEDPSKRGAVLVEATAPDGTVESATFFGRNASERAFKYVEAVDYFEKRKPTEYPKYVRRGGVEHLILDAEHEKRIGPPTDADKKADEAQAKARDDIHGRHAAFDEAQARASGASLPGPRPERISDGEDDTAYGERLAKWQDQRRGVIGDATAEQKPAVEAVQIGGQPVAEHANTGFQTDSTKYPSVAGESAGEHYEPVDNVRSADGVHAGGPLQGTAPPASSPEAQRLRDIAARRRAPDIENASED
jgi:hypothetical protein